MHLILLSFINGVSSGVLYAMTAFGLTFILGMLNIPNFAHGALYALGAYLLFSLTGAITFWGAAAAAAVIVGLVGVLLERGLVRHLYTGAPEDEHYQLLLLFAVALIARQVIILIWGAPGKSVLPPTGLDGIFQVGAIFYPKYRVFLILVPSVIMLATWFVIERTRVGALIRASIERSEMVQLLGIDVRRVFALSFGFGAFLAALSGALALPISGATPYMGFDILAVSFVVVALGGLGNLYGAIPAGLLVGVTQNFASLISPIGSWVAIYAVMAVVLLFRPQGLFGSR